jgi:hypothetical protein
VRRCLSSATVGPSITHSYARGATTPEWLSVLSARARCPAPLRSPPHRTPSRCVLAFAAIIPQLVVRARRNSARTPTCRALVLRCSSRRRSGAGLVQPPTARTRSSRCARAFFLSSARRRAQPLQAGCGGITVCRADLIHVRFVARPRAHRYPVLTHRLPRSTGACRPAMPCSRSSSRLRRTRTHLCCT